MQYAVNKLGGNFVCKKISRRFSAVLCIAVSLLEMLDHSEELLQAIEGSQQRPPLRKTLEVGWANVVQLQDFFLAWPSPDAS